MIGVIILAFLGIGLVVITNDRKHKIEDCLLYLRAPHQKSMKEAIFGE